MEHGTKLYDCKDISEPTSAIAAKTKGKSQLMHKVSTKEQ
jgi:hypothetical protein